MPGVLRVCLVCGKEFRVKPVVVKKGHGKFCSRKCKAEYMKRRVKRVCEQCGKEFEVWESCVKKGHGKFCSVECYKQYMRSEDGRIELSRRNRSIWLNPKSRQKLSEAVRRLWQNPEYREKWRKRNELRWKSSEFRKRMSEFAKEAWKNPEFRRKRSEETKKLWQNLEFREKCITKKLEALQIKPNGLEKAVCDLLQSYFLNEWRYIGNGKMSIAGFIPDFVHKEEKWIIEVNGNYWHNLPGVKEKDERKRKAYEKYGYRVLEVWEREFRSNPIGVVNKIMEYFYQES